MVITAQSPLALGSSSPRRREMLTMLGVPLRVVQVQVFEQRRPGEKLVEYLQRIVNDKLAAAASRVAGFDAAALLVADTVVVADDDLLGKPGSVAQAERLLARLAGRSHQVHTRYAIAHGDAPANAIVSRTVSSTVTMRSADAQELRAYARTGEGLDKAGAYAIQGIGSFLVERVEGSYSNVVGLPVCEVIADLKSAGLLLEFP
jgi:septum formation protein